MAVALLAGCGGSSHKTTTTTSQSTTGSVPAAQPRSGLYAHVLASNELPGFSSNTSLVIERDPRLFLIETQTPTSQVGPATARLKRLGFVAELSENLNGPGQAGLSLVEQFRSPSSPRAELAHEITMFKSQGGFKPFNVTGIPGAVGFSETTSSGSGINIAFAKGDYYYLVGETITVPGASAESTLNSAAHHLFQRVDS
jgi:hypothetical protein